MNGGNDTIWLLEHVAQYCSVLNNNRYNNTYILHATSVFGIEEIMKMKNMESVFDDHLEQTMVFFL